MVRIIIDIQSGFQLPETLEIKINLNKNNEITSESTKVHIVEYSENGKQEEIKQEEENNYAKVVSKLKEFEYKRLLEQEYGSRVYIIGPSGCGKNLVLKDIVSHLSNTIWSIISPTNQVNDFSQQVNVRKIEKDEDNMQKSIMECWYDLEKYKEGMIFNEVPTNVKFFNNQWMKWISSAESCDIHYIQTSNSYMFLPKYVRQEMKFIIISKYISMNDLKKIWTECAASFPQWNDISKLFQTIFEDLNKKFLVIDKTVESNNIEDFLFWI